MISSAKTVAKRILELGHKSTALLDSRFLNRDIQLQFPPVFIVGVPRSGTTLLYQLMMSAFKFAYIPNVANTWYQCPITATRWALRWCQPYQSLFASRHGYEQGCLAPSEAGNIWNRWFPYEKREGFNYTPAGWLSDSAQQEIVRCVAHIEQLFDAPFLTKNVKMSVRIAALREMFPGALFIHISRDPLDAALSLLVVRRKNNKEWWSVLPREYAELEALPELEQVCKQVYFTEQNILDDVKGISDRVHSLPYSTVCSQPHLTITELSQYFNQSEMNLAPDLKDVPDSFPVSQPKTQGVVSPEEVEKMRQMLDELFGSSTL